LFLIERNDDVSVALIVGRSEGCNEVDEDDGVDDNNNDDDDDDDTDDDDDDESNDLGIDGHEDNEIDEVLFIVGLVLEVGYRDGSSDGQ
jgi:hypothetical protein